MTSGSQRRAVIMEKRRAKRAAMQAKLSHERAGQTHEESEHWSSLSIPMLTPLLKTITDDELRFIAGLDYGFDSESHLEALRAVVFEQDGNVSGDQFWFPYEVIELGASHLHAGHEREFFFCTMLVLQAVISGRDSWTDIEFKLEWNAHNYDSLPPDLRDQVLRALEQTELRERKR